MSTASADRKGRALGVAALFLVAGMWSLNGPLIKLLNAQGEGVSAATIAFYRSFFGGVFFAPLAARRWRSLKQVRPAWPTFSVLMFTLMTSTFIIATTLTAAANAVILQYTAPVWVFALSPALLKERARFKEGAALSGAMVGVVVIFLGNPVSDRWALALALLSGFGYGSLLVTLRGLRAVNPFVVVCLNSLGSAVLLAPSVALWGSFAFTKAQLVLLLVIGLVQFGVPYMIYSWAARHVEASRASLIVLIETVLNPTWTYLAVGETFPPATWIGGALVLISVAGWMTVSFRRGRPRRSA